MTGQALRTRIAQDVAGTLAGVALMAYGVVRDGTFHPGLIPLVVLLAAVLAWIGRSTLPPGRRARPRPTLARLAPLLLIVVAIAAYAEIDFEGGEVGDTIVSMAGIPIAMGLAALYHSLRARRAPGA